MDIFDGFNRHRPDPDGVAIDIDLATGVLEECPVCRTIFDRQHDELLAVAQAGAQRHFDSGDPSVAIFRGDREDLIQRLDQVRERFEYDCLCDAG